jgi:hypothetical protein
VQISLHSNASPTPCSPMDACDLPDQSKQYWHSRTIVTRIASNKEYCLNQRQRNENFFVGTIAQPGGYYSGRPHTFHVVWR